MKVSFYFSILFLCGSISLYGMEASEGAADSSFEALPAELRVKILKYTHEPLPIKDGIQDVVEWQHEGALLVEWSPNSEYIAIDGRESSDHGEVHIRTFVGEKRAVLANEGVVSFASRLRGRTIWSPDSSLIALSNGEFEKKDPKIIIYTNAGEKQYEVGGKRTIFWLPDGRLLSHGDDDRIQIHTPKGELVFTCESSRAFLNLWSDKTGGEKRKELFRGDWLKVIRSFYSVDPNNNCPISFPCSSAYVGEKKSDKAIDMFDWSPDGTRFVKYDSSFSGNKVQLGTADGAICAEWEGSFAAWLSCSRLVGSFSDAGNTLYTRDGDKYAEWKLDKDVWFGDWSSDGSLMVWVCLHSNIVKICTNRGKKLAEYEHDDDLKDIPWSLVGVQCAKWAPNGECIGSLGPHGLVKIKRISRLLLANHKLSHPTINQHLLLKKLQQGLLQENKSVELNTLGRDTLRGMPEIEKLLRVEKRKKAQHWRVMLKHVATQKEEDDS